MGEHDCSPQWADGPSDGGAIQVTVTPDSIAAWVAAVQDNPDYVLTNPIPGADAGMGSCAAGACFSVRTQQRTIFQGGNHSKQRDAANCDGKS